MRILHLEDEPLDSELAKEQLRADGMDAELDRVDTLAAFREALGRGGYSLVLSDYTIPGTNPLEALRLHREMRPEVPFVFLSGTIGEELATQALRLGASDYVLKQRMEHLSTVVRRSIGEAQEAARRKEAEAALRRSEERLRLAQEVARIGTFEWNIRDSLHEWSPELEALYGKAPGSFGHSYEAWRTCVHPEDLEVAERSLQNALETGSFEGEWRACWDDGSTRWIAARGHVFRDEAGRPLSMVGVNIDITERKQAEEAVLQAKHSAEHAKERAEEANRAKDRFLAILSHELRTPLTAVLPALDAMQPIVPDSAAEYLEIATRNVELEARLIDDLLDINRIARGKVELNREVVDLCGVLQRAVDVCRASIESRGMHFLLKVETAPQTVEADPARLQQVFWNLIQNAVKFTPPGGCIGIRSRTLDSHSVVEIHDSGAGIEREALARIFNAFEQEAKSITRQFGGLGLGLAISKALVELHGGTIRAQSEGKGKGSVFVVSFPAANGVAHRAVPKSAPANSAEVGHLSILLVEDHPDTAKILRHVLHKAGHQVAHAGDVATALQLLQQERFDILLSDLGLPDGSGHDLLRRAITGGITIPAIALSGYGTATDIEQSRQAGFREHLVKPISMTTLNSALARVLTASHV